MKRDCGKEDLVWETARKQPGSEVSSDAINELREEKECEKQPGEEIDFQDYGLIKRRLEVCVDLHVGI